MRFMNDTYRQLKVYYKFFADGSSSSSSSSSFCFYDSSSADVTQAANFAIVCAISSS
jgi:hypothetical protein